MQNGWYSGTILANHCSYKYKVKVFNAPSEYGIEGCNISKASITKHGKLVLCFDRGWDIKPADADKATWNILATLVKHFSQDKR